MVTTAPPRGRPWRLAALATGAVIAAGLVFPAPYASAGTDPGIPLPAGVPAPASDNPPAPVLTCQTPIGSPLPTPSVVPAPRVVPGDPAVARVDDAVPAPAPPPGTTATPADTTPPTAPGDVTAELRGATRAAVAWSAADDNTGVTGYEVWGSVYFEIPGWATICANTRIATVPGTITSLDLELSPPTNPKVTVVRYAFFVRARDAAGNVSTPSNTARITVPSQPG